MIFGRHGKIHFQTNLLGFTEQFNSFRKKYVFLARSSMIRPVWLKPRSYNSQVITRSYKINEDSCKNTFISKTVYLCYRGDLVIASRYYRNNRARIIFSKYFGFLLTIWQQIFYYGLYFFLFLYLAVKNFIQQNYIIFVTIFIY